MIFKDGKTFSAYVRSKLHSSNIALFALDLDVQQTLILVDLRTANLSGFKISAFCLTDMQQNN